MKNQEEHQLCGPARAGWPRLSREEIQSLSTPDFLSYIGKRVINPGGIEAFEKIIENAKIKSGSHVLDIGGGNGKAACRIAEHFKCKVTMVDISPRNVQQAQERVARLGLTGQVQCEVGDINDLRFGDHTFDYVICQGVIMYTKHQQSLAEVRRVLKEDGVFAGQEACWRKLPPETLRSRTSAICGGGQVDFHSLYGWIGVLRESAFEDVEAAEHTFQFFSLKGMLRDEGWLNSLCIGLGLLLSPARREKMAEIRSHFFEHGNYFSYVVFSARKQAAGRMRLDAAERMVA